MPKKAPRPRECHTCPRFEKPDDYCWKVCPGPAAISEKGQKKVRTSALKAPDEFINKEALDPTGEEAHPSHGSVTATLSPDTESALITVIATLFGKCTPEDDTNLLLFKRAFLGQNLRESGASLPHLRPMTKQAVHKRVVAMIRKNDVFSKVLVQMIRTGKGGAKGSVVQGELNLDGSADYNEPETYGEVYEQEMERNTGYQLGKGDGGGKGWEDSAHGK